MSIDKIIDAFANAESLKGHQSAVVALALASLLGRLREASYAAVDTAFSKLDIKSADDVAARKITNQNGNWSLEVVRKDGFRYVAPIIGITDAASEYANEANSIAEPTLIAVDA